MYDEVIDPVAECRCFADHFHILRRLFAAPKSFTDLVALLPCRLTDGIHHNAVSND
jgi:hypothetical protein